MSALWSLGYLSTALEALWVNLALSGDNAVAAANAARRLPRHQRPVALGLGAVGATLLRLACTGPIVALLTLPGAHVVAALLLVIIAVRLLIQGDDGPGAVAKAEVTVTRTVAVIVTTDLMMSLDNVIAVAAVAADEVGPMVAGLTASIAIVMLGGGVVTRLTGRSLQWLGAALITWAAGQMLYLDAVLVLQRTVWLSAAAHLAAAIAVIGAAWYLRPRPEDAPTAEG